MISLGAGIELRFDCDLARLEPPLRDAFVELDYDEATRAFVQSTLAAPHGWAITALYGLLRRILSDYEAYGMLGMYPMHLLSTAQVQRLLPQAGGRLLDVGAGDGGVTRALAARFSDVVATEQAASLRKRLRRRGVEVSDFDPVHGPWPQGPCFDAIGCLNVLDRTSHPRSMLMNLIASLKPGGVLVIALPLPLSPHVQAGAHTVDPEETLPEGHDDWEEGANQIFRELLQPNSLRVQTLTRVPYLCRGDAHSRLHVLDDVLFVCRFD